MRHPCVDFPAVWAVVMCVLAARRCVILLHHVPVLIRDHLPWIMKIIFKYASVDNFQWIAVLSQRDRQKPTCATSPLPSCTFKYWLAPVGFNLPAPVPVIRESPIPHLDSRYGTDKIALKLLMYLVIAARIHIYRVSTVHPLVLLVIPVKTVLVAGNATRPTPRTIMTRHAAGPAPVMIMSLRE